MTMRVCLTHVAVRQDFRPHHEFTAKLLIGDRPVVSDFIAAVSR
jgi:hypothetical protein